MADSDIVEFQKIKMVSFIVAAGILLLIWEFFFKSIPLNVQLAFLGVSLAITGIPHGALDHLVQREQSKRQKNHFNLLIFLGRYLAIMLFYALAWYSVPQFSLFFFILISCWHFGETDIDLMPSFPVFTSLLRLFYGIAVFTWILITHEAEVSPILLHMVKSGSSIYYAWTTAVSNRSWLVATSGAVMIIALFVTKFINHVKRYSYLLLLELVFILLGMKWLPLLPAFALYFAGWHSLITFFNIKKFITSKHITGNKRFIKLWLSALPFSLIAIAGLLLSGYFFTLYAPLFDPIPLLFIFLSLITLPHMEVMHKLNTAPAN